ncbi:MAG: hypothetical protein B7Z22_14460, partial [Hyphomonas sp. 32-62-5]
MHRALGNLGVLWDEVRSTIIGFTYRDDLSGHLYIDPTFEKLQKEFENVLKKTIRIQSASADRTMFTVSAEAPGVPVEFYLYDASVSELSPLGSIAPQLAGQATGRVSSFAFEARDGLDILPEIKNKGANGHVPKIVILTVRKEQRIIEQAFALGADAYVTKPF